tara:strand:+ start:652 stop:930 length:279 start_codon:yes stop_codon:yes gene_type:complete
MEQNKSDDILNKLDPEKIKCTWCKLFKGPDSYQLFKGPIGPDSICDKCMDKWTKDAKKQPAEQWQADAGFMRATYPKLITKDLISCPPIKKQ